MRNTKAKIIKTVRLAILISGGGTTMEAILRACQKNGPLYKKIVPVVVISDRICEGLRKAQRYGIPTRTVKKSQITDGKELLETLKKYRPDVITQNGWLSKTPVSILKKYEGRIYNQHPAPLDPGHKNDHGYPLHFGGKGIFGKAAHAAVLEFQRLSGRIFPTEATIHRVTEQFDEGEVVARRPVDIISTDTTESLSQRMLFIEHELQIEFLKRVYQSSVKLLIRKNPLIQNTEEQYLVEAKKSAIASYPHG